MGEIFSSSFSFDTRPNMRSHADTLLNSQVQNVTKNIVDDVDDSEEATVAGGNQKDWKKRNIL